MKFTLACTAAVLLAISTGAQATTLQIIADNDFAMFVGTDTNVTRLVYQNNVVWGSQISALTSFTFTLQSGETTLYLLGMGGGGQENVSGTVNGTDITTIPVSMSSDLSSYLTGYSSNLSAVAGGTYNASLADVQTAFPNLTWGSPTYNNTQTVILQSPTKQGYTFGSDSAHLFEFTAGDVSLTPAPEPSTAASLMIAGIIFATIGRKRVLAGVRRD